MAEVLDLNSAQQARVVELLEDLEVRVTQAALEGPASLQEAAREARRLLEEEIPPDRRERFRNWMGEHRDWMMNEMCDEEMMRSNWRGEQDWNRWRRSEDR
jgi:hypothetical protein